MDYTQSNAFTLHAGTGNRMHSASQATPTAVSDADLNGPAWELVSLIKQAGITPAGFDANTPATYQQVAAAIAALQRQQTNTAYTTAGTAPAFTVTLPASAVALAALGANLRLRLKFHAAGTGNDTLAIGSLAAKSLKQYDSTGAKVGSVIAAGQLVDVEYDGVDFVLLDPLPSDQAGDVRFFARQTAPTGFLKANGAAISRTAYATLFAAVNTTFGAGDGSTTFNLPDLRGEFLRGFDDGRGVDSGRTFGSKQLGSLVIADTGGAIENTIEGIQGGNLYMDTKTYEYDAGGVNYKWFSVESTGVNPSTTTMALPSAISELMPVRPRNVALLACIKY